MNELRISRWLRNEKERENRRDSSIRPRYKENYKQKGQVGLKKVDVIIPVKNTGRHWKTCLDNFYREIPINRLLIGDGGCTDNTIKIATKYPQVTVFDHSKFKTLGYSIKHLINAVETEWFVYLHADVFLPDGWYGEMSKHRKEWDWFECRRIGVYSNGIKQELIGQYKAYRAYSGSQMGKNEVLKKAVESIEDDYIFRTEDIIIQQNVEKLGYIYGKSPNTFHYHYLKGYNPTLKDAIQTAQAIIKYLLPARENVKTVYANIRKLARNNLLTDADWQEWAKKVNPIWCKWIPAISVNTTLGQSILNDTEYKIFSFILDIGCGDRGRGNVNLDVTKTKSSNLIASAQKLPLKPERFSLVFCSQVLEHLEHPTVATQEIERVLTNNGLGLIDVPSGIFTSNMLWHFFRFIFNLPFTLRPREVKFILSDVNAIKKGDSKRTHKHVINRKLIEQYLTIVDEEKFAPLFLTTLENYFNRLSKKLGWKKIFSFSRLNGGILFRCRK